MFQQTFVPDARPGRKPIGLAVSLIAQSLALGLLALLPLLVNKPLPTAQLRLLFLGPTPPVGAEKPVRRTTTATQTTAVRARLFRLTAPVVVPKQINPSAEGAPTAPDIADVSGLNPGRDSLLNGVGGSFGSVAPPMPKQAAKVKEVKRPVSIGGNVAAANLIHRVEPVYPPLAKTARIQGVVTFQATIGADGEIRNLQLQEGHPLLVSAARNAILQWRYRPTLLNGKPVEVLTTITVRFSLSQ
jgi:periplasmic protein TonB